MAIEIDDTQPYLTVRLSGKLSAKAWLGAK